MNTVGREYNKGAVVPVCVYNDLKDYCFEEKRYHILFIEEGSGSISYAGHKELFMGPLIFCFNEDETPKIGMDSNLHTKSIYLSPEYVNNRFTFDNIRDAGDQFTLTDIRDRHWFEAFFIRSDNYSGRINLSLATAKRLSNMFDLLASQLASQPDYYWPCRSRSFLIEILFLIEQCRFVGNKDNNMYTDGYSEEVEKIILYLYGNYNRKITISELVKEFNIDRTTLTNKFNQEVGDSVIVCLIKLRINLSSMMLRDTLIPVSEIMYRVGFSDISHFNRTFKKHTGFNPSEYRQKFNILTNN